MAKKKPGPPKGTPQHPNSSKTRFKKGNPYAFKPKAPDPDAPQPLTLTDPTGEFTTKQLNFARDVAALDVSDATIAEMMGLTPAEFKEAKRTNTALSSALEIGKGRAEDKLVRTLQALSKKWGVAAISLLKAKHLYREDDPFDDTPRITINIPPAGSSSNVIAGERLADDDIVHQHPSTVGELYERMGQPDDPLDDGRDSTEQGKAHDLPATHRIVGKALIPLTLTERIHQASELAAGRTDPYAAPINSPATVYDRPPTDAERRAHEDAEFKYGISRDRNSFDSEAAWNRFNKSR